MLAKTPEHAWVLFSENPLDTENLTRRVLELPNGAATIGSMLPNGAPEGIVIGVNGHVIPREQYGLHMIRPNDHVVVVPALHGGDGGGKTILRIVATVALMYVTAGLASGAIAGGLTGAAAAGGATLASTALAVGVQVVGGMLINSLLPIQPAQAEVPDPFEDSPSYGLDGPKQTARQGQTLPVVYGTARIAGNRVGLFTEDNGDNNQTVHVLTMVCEGPIGGINPEATLFNDQPIANYAADADNVSEVGLRRDAIVMQTSNGDSQGRQPVLFNTAGVPRQVGAEVTTEWTNYTTVGAINSFSINFVAPQGLIETDPVTGNTKGRVVEFEIQYRESGASEWRTCEELDAHVVVDQVKAVYFTSANINVIQRPEEDEEEYVLYRSAGRLNVEIGPAFLEDGSVNGDAMVGDTVRHRYSRVDARGRNTSVTVGVGTIRWYQRNSLRPFIEGETRQAARRTYHFYDTLKTVELSNGNTITADPIERLEGNIYDIRWRRIVAEDESDYVADSVHVSDVVEVVADELPNFVHTAYADVRITLGERVNSVPNMTFEVFGRRIRSIFADENGAPRFEGSKPLATYYATNAQGEKVPLTAYDEGLRVSANPADIVLDMLTDTRIGMGYGDDAIDLTAFAGWADYCREHGLEFNAAFETQGTMWDSVSYVLRAGHANLITRGNKFSVAVERPELPMMLFNMGNIMKGSMSVDWMDRSERINEVHVTYFDAGDLHKRKTLVKSDPDLFENPEAAGKSQRVHNLNAYWVTNQDQAELEAIFEINQSKLIDHTVTFTTSAEAARCRVGSVVMVQHDLPSWNEGGRVESGCTKTTIVLDHAVEAAAGKNYSVLVAHTTLKRADGNQAERGATHAGFDTILLKDFPSANIGEKDKVRRVVLDGEEYGVSVLMRDYKESGYVAVTLDRAAHIAEGQFSWEAWDVDVLEERAVVGQTGTLETIQLDEPLSKAPDTHTKWLFGEADRVKRLYRVQRVSNVTGYEIEIMATEYNEQIYDFSAVADMEAVPQLDGIGHVEGLAVEEQLLLQGSIYKSKLNISWRPPLTGVYEGADVLARRGSAPYVRVAQVGEARTSHTMDVTAGEQLDVKVVAFDSLGRRAPVDGTPQVTVEPEGDKTPPSHASNLTIKSDINQLGLRWTNPADPDFKTAIVWRSNTASYAAATAVSEVDGETFVDQVDPGTTWHYWVTTKDYAGNVTDLSEAPTVSGQARSVELEDIPNLPPEYQVLVVRDNMELFAFEENVSGSRGTVGSNLDATRVDGASPFGTPCYSFDPASNNLLYTDAGVDFAGWSREAGVEAFIEFSNGEVTVDASGAEQAIQLRGKAHVNALADGATYTASVYVENRTNEQGSVSIDFCGDGAENYDLAPGAKLRIRHTGSRATYDETYRFMDIKTLTGKLTYRKPQIEKRTYPTPFMGESGRQAASRVAWSSYGEQINPSQFAALWWYRCNEEANPNEQRIFLPSGAGLSVRFRDDSEVMKLQGAIKTPSGDLNINFNHGAGYVPIGDHDWHLMGFSFDGQSGIVRMFRDETFSEDSVEIGSRYDIEGQKPFYQGNWQSHSDRFSVRGYISHQLVIKSGTLAPETVKKIYQLRAPFIDPGAVIQAPNPENITIELL